MCGLIHGSLVDNLRLQVKIWESLECEWCLTLSNGGPHLGLGGELEGSLISEI